MNKRLLLIPAALLAVLGAVAVTRSASKVGGPARKSPAPFSAPSIAPVEASVSAPAAPPKPLAPVVSEMTPEERGIALDRVALRNQVSIYVSAALRKDEITAKAMRNSLVRRVPESRSVVEERKATARGAEEKKVLGELLGYLR